MNPIAYHFNCPDWRTKIDYLMTLLKSKVKYYRNSDVNPNFEIIICNSSEKSGITQECLDKMNYPHIWLGKGIDWKYNTIKIRLIIDYLRKSNKKYVMHLDASDVPIVDNPEIILERYLKYYPDNKLVFASELTSFPDYYQWQVDLYGPDAKEASSDLGKSKFYRYNWPSEKLRNKKYCFLNAGCWIGERDYALKYFESIEKYIGQTSEQTYVQKTFPNFVPETTIDNKCLLFQCMVCCDESEIKHLLNKNDYEFCKTNYDKKIKIMNQEIRNYNYMILIIFFIISSFVSFIYFYI